MANHTPHYEPLSSCPNCETAFDTAAAAPRYCPHCGQETVLHPPSIAEFLHEFIGHYVALEGSLWRTLRLLLLRPGQLTREYLAGRRRRYVLPLRLYLSASFLFFLVAKLGPQLSSEPPLRHVNARPAAAVAVSTPASATQMPELCGTPTTRPCSWLDRRMEASRHELNADPERAEAEFKAHLMAKAPYVMFFLLPLFAGVLALAYRSRRMLFGEHMVFCMHLMSFWFLAAALGRVLPEVAGVAIFTIAAVYTVRALQVVYRGRWGWTIARAAFSTAAYGVLLLAGVTILTFAVLMA